MIILKTKGNKNNGAKNNTMDDSNIQMLFEFNADAYEKVKNKKKLYKFFKQMGHITFEKADLQNNTDWFNKAMSAGYKESMDFHREGVRGIFGMENYDEWVKSLS